SDFKILHEIFDCIFTIQICREAMKIESDPKLKLVHFIGEMDYTCELRSLIKMQTAHMIAAEVATEVERARRLFPNINSLHEGLGVIMEEFEEFKQEVFDLNILKGRDTRARARTELLQLA